MTPVPGTSGGAANQQRAERRAEKIAAAQRAAARQQRTRTIGWSIGIAAALVVAALIVVSVVTTPLVTPARYTPGSGDGDIAGLETFQNTNIHVAGTVQYPQTPPAGGDHNQVWLNCGVYSQQVPSENAVHSLEHGAVWVTYQPGLPEEQLRALRSKLPSTYVILSPFAGLDSPFVLSAWNAQLKLDDPNDERIAEFFSTFWQAGMAPELGASCAGALEGPGLVS